VVASSIDRRPKGEAVTEPVYRRIAQDLRDKIASGEVAPGGQLPSELELKDRYGASRNTIRDAVRWLMRRGLVETRPGQGTFATRRFEPFVTTLSADPDTGIGGAEGEGALAEVRERGRTPSASVPRVEVLFADSAIAARLRIPVGTQVVRRTQDRYIDRQPWSREANVVPMDLVTGGAPDLLLAADLDGGIAAYLSRRLGIAEVGHRDRILVRPATDDESRFFGLSTGSDSVVSLVRTSYQPAKPGPAPLRVTFTVLPADRSQFVINTGAVPETLAPAAEG
jgi:GntR family transcriptional regulator